MAARKRHYINNKDLFESLCKYLDTYKHAEENSLTLPRIPDYIGSAFKLLCERISSKPNFAYYSYREDMIGDGIENCVMQIRSFNPNKSDNPFAYFTQIIVNAFIRRIKKEKKQHYIKIMNMNNMNISDEIAGIQSSGTQVNEITDEYVRNFESSLAKAKKKQNTSTVSKFIETKNE